MVVEGKWHAAGSAAQQSAALQFNGDDYVLQLEGGKSHPGHIADLSISDRLGNVERKIGMPDGSVFSTPDNHAVDRLFASKNKIVQLVHTLESNIGWVIVALVLTIAVSLSFFKWGIPWTSTKIAHALPHKANEIVAAGAFDFLDEYFFEPSKLDLATIGPIKERFYDRLVTLSQSHDAIQYELHFRAWNDGEKGIPNALALPSGDIILTDRFVELSENSDEVDSVLLHEIGHVVNRHTLETLIEGTLVTTIVMMATGDNNGLADMGIGVGSLLVSSIYSRAHETEADLYAFQKMLEAKIDPKAFSTILKRMSDDMNEGVVFKDDETEPLDNNELLDYLSSHPSTSQRVDLANRFGKCFEDGLTVCSMQVDH